MSQEPAMYRYDLGRGLYLDAFSLDPNLDESRLAEIVATSDGKFNPKALAVARATIRKTDSLQSLSELTLEPLEGVYTVPEPLIAYREAIQADWDNKGRFNGPVLIATGEIRAPLRVRQGGYYDFAATKMTDVPAKLLPEVYESGKTVEDILRHNGISTETRAKYFGMAHLMHLSNGDEFLLVLRAKGMGIADNVIATPGSTPDLVLNKPGLIKPNFGIREYWSYHLAEEMKDEFHLGWGDFWVGSIDLYEDKKSIPFGAVNIHTELSSKEISQKAYGDPRVLKEHNIVFGIPRETLPQVLKRFQIFPSVSIALENM